MRLSVKRVMLSAVIVGLALTCSVLGSASAAPAVGAASASGPTQINAFYTDAPVEPSWFTPSPGEPCENYNNNTRYVDAINWSSWGGPEATGTAVAGRGCAEYDANTGVETPIGPQEGSSVTVTLGGLEQCAGFSIYTTYSLALAPGASEPGGFSQLKSGRFPCNVAAPGCSGGAIPGKFELKGPVDCALGLDNLVGKRSLPTRWQPRKPPGQITQLRRLMAAQWKDWNGVKTTGIGAMLDQHKIGRGAETDLLWPGEVELTDPIWCPRLGNAIAYTSLRLTLYGTGIKEKRRKPRSYYERLMVRVRKMVGEPGLRIQVFTQHATASASSCGF